MSGGSHAAGYETPYYITGSLVGGRGNSDFEEVKKRTNGRVEITVFPGTSLCKPTPQYDCAKSGIADLAWGVTGWTPGRFPMTSVIELPFLVRSAAVSAQILADLWEP